MALETASYISQLVATNPTASDPKSQGDNHLRMVKTVLQTQFPNFGTTAITATAAEVNYLVGVTSAVQTQINAKAPIASPTFTGTVTIPAGAVIDGYAPIASPTFTGTVTIPSGAVIADYAPLASPALTGTPTAPTAAAGTSTTQIASTAFVQGVAFSAALPAQTGNAGKFVTTDGASASWAEAVTPAGAQALTNKTIDLSLNTILNLPGNNILRSARTSNTALTTTDKGTLIDITSGTFSQTFDAVATLGDGWWCYLRNSGTGDITLDPDSTELIDGLASYVMYPGEVRLVQCDGAALRSIVLNAFYRVFTASGTFTKPPGYSRFEGLLWGGGGSGRKGAAANSRTGGSGAACSPFQLHESLVSASESVVIGAGGASATANSTNGNAGGYSSIAGIVAAPGQGGSSAASVGGGTAYSQSNFSVISASDNHVISGSSGGGTSGSAKGYFGGDTAKTTATNGAIYGAGAGGGLDANDTVTIGGASVFGGSGGASSKTGNANNGNAPGGGGGAAQDGAGNSGAGARGELRIWGVI